MLAPTTSGKFLSGNDTQDLLWPLLQWERSTGGHRRRTYDQELNLGHFEDHLAMAVPADCHGAFTADG